MQCLEGEDNYQGDVYDPERDAEGPLDAALPTVEPLRGEVVGGLELNIGDGCPMATFWAHTASPPPPSRTPAGSRASSRDASIAPRTTSAHGPLTWAAPRTRTHRSIPAPPTPAGASLPRRSSGRRVPSNQASLPSAPAADSSSSIPTDHRTADRSRSI